MMGAVVDGIYILGLLAALVYFWRWLDPLGEARSESNSVAAGGVFLMLLYCVIFLAVAWPVVLVIVGIGWVIGTVIRKVI